MSEYEEIDKSDLPGFVYLMDDGRDLKLGITRNIDNRLNRYITENPRLKCHDSFQADSLAHAEEIEQELIDATNEYRTHGKEWCKRCKQVFAIWEEVAHEYAKLTYAEWIERQTDSELNRSKELLIPYVIKQLDEAHENTFMHFGSYQDLIFCHVDYFDGTVLKARKIVCDHYRKWMEKIDCVYTHFEDDGVTIIKSTEVERLQKIESEYKAKTADNNTDSNKKLLNFCLFCGALLFLLIIGMIGMS